MANKISTRRVQGGRVHEMADRGTATMCGLDLAEPWTWTDRPLRCAACKSALAHRCGLCLRKRFSGERKGWTMVGADARCPDCNEEDRGRTEARRV